MRRGSKANESYPDRIKPDKRKRSITETYKRKKLLGEQWLAGDGRKRPLSEKHKEKIKAKLKDKPFKRVHRKALSASKTEFYYQKAAKESIPDLADKPLLTTRWTRLKPHAEQQRLVKRPKRFNVNPAGRRSGKTELAKRKLVRRAMKGTPFDDPRFFAAAPTRDQAKRIYWEDLKRLTPRWVMQKPPSESDLTITYTTGSTIQVLGMDKPERIEGVAWDGGILDEYGNMKKNVWGEHVRPALADRKGWCDFIGVPEGRNHYYDLAKKAQQDETGEWDYFHWISADILDPQEIIAAKNDLDELTYLQEFEGCHAPDTLVLLWNGTVKKVRRIAVGDVLVSAQQGVLIPTRVLACGTTGIKDMLEVELEDLTLFRASSHHKMRIGGRVLCLIDCAYLEKAPVYFKPSTRDQKLAAIVGFNLGDGWVTKRKEGGLSACFYSYDRQGVVDLLSDLHSLGLGLGINIGEKKGGGHQIQFSNKDSLFLVKSGCVVGSKVKQDFGIPAWIKENKDIDVQKSFLAALFGAEGTIPRPGKTGKQIKDINLAMCSKRLVEECAEMMSNVFGLKAVVKRKEKYCRVYTNFDFIDKIGYLYCPIKQERSWLYQRYMEASRARRKQVKGLRGQGLKWKEIGDLFGLKMTTARVIGLSESTRISNFFDDFASWVKKHYSDGKLKLKIISKTPQNKEKCWNVAVDSPDHSYLLADGLDNFNSFINFQGRIYYPYSSKLHNARIQYNPQQPLHFCFDFNVAPGVAAVVQEKQVIDMETGAILIGETVSGIIGEVYIPQNSNTALVCNKLGNDWREHQGLIYCYGDATGGAKGSAKLAGSDWDIIKKVLRGYFGDRLHFDYPEANPSERDRVNAVNSRLLTMQGKVRLLVDPSKAPHVDKDFEGVQCVQGGSGEIDKKKNPELSHISDAIGYYVWRKFPVRKIQAGMISTSGF